MNTMATKSLKNLYPLAVLAALTLLTTSCGGSAPATDEPPADEGPDTSLNNPAPAPAPQEPEEDTTLPEGAPVQPLDVTAVGYEGVATVTVKAKDVLKVRFVPLQQMGKATSGGYVAQYSLLSVVIRVGTQEVVTPLLDNGFDGAPKTQSSVYDFSSAFTKGPGLRDDVTITVTHANYDHLCRQGYTTGCPSQHVTQTHPWYGQLLIQTDDTQELE